MKNLFSILTLTILIGCFTSCKKDDPQPQLKAVTTTTTVDSTYDDVYFAITFVVPISNTTVGVLDTIHYSYDTDNVNVFLNGSQITINPYKTYEGCGRVDGFNNFTESVKMKTGDSLVFKVSGLMYVGGSSELVVINFANAPLKPYHAHSTTNVPPPVIHWHENDEIGTPKQYIGNAYLSDYSNSSVDGSKVWYLTGVRKFVYIHK